jgi:uncharacterized membrane-anchored protein
MLSKNKLLILIATIQILFFTGWYYLEYKKLHNPISKIILVKTVPVDPRDYLSGNFFTLRYEFSDFWYFGDNSEKIKQTGTEINAFLQKSGETGNEIYAVLKKNDIWYVPDYFSLEKPLIKNDQVIIKGKFNKASQLIDYGIEKYFINENIKEPKFGDKLEVMLVVGDDLTARIKSLIINGNEFKQ